MSNNQKIAYGCFVFFAFALISGAAGGKIISGLVGGIPFLLIGIYFFKKNSNFRNKIKNSPNSWDFWDKEIHSQKRQLRKQQRALYLQPYKTDVDNSRAEFVSMDTGEVYDTSLISCTCESFKKDIKPCKHMYCLSYNLGVFTPDRSVVENAKEFEEKEAFMKEFSRLDRETQRKIAYEHFSSENWSFVSKEESTVLLSTSLLCTTDDLTVVLPKLKKSDLIEILDKYNISYGNNPKKQTLIDTCLGNKDILYIELTARLPVPVKLNKEAERYLGSFRGRYANTYAEN